LHITLRAADDFAGSLHDLERRLGRRSSVIASIARPTLGIETPIGAAVAPTPPGSR